MRVDPFGGQTVGMDEQALAQLVADVRAGTDLPGFFQAAAEFKIKRTGTICHYPIGCMHSV